MAGAESNTAPALSPRIALIHALEESVMPARGAFGRDWPQAFAFDLLDTSLAVDRARAGRLDEAMFARFEALARYAAGSSGEGGATSGILFTCSAFGPAIDAVKARSTIPVLRPNEAAFAEALGIGDRIGLVVSFEPSQAALQQELHEMAAALGRKVSVACVLAEGALAALKAGDGDRHDRLVAEAVQRLPGVDAVILGQFSLERARALASSANPAPIITTPASAVRKLKALLSGGRNPTASDPQTSNTVQE